MAQAKPNCKDFILAAIRKIRLNPSNLKEGTKAGTSLYRLWAVASEVYSENEFREGLQLLLQEKTLVASWRIASVAKGNTWGVLRSEVIEQIPPELPLGQGIWRRDKDSKTIDYSDRETVEHDLICSAKLFVEADGLPQNVTKLQRKNVGARASQIIAEMQKGE